MTTTFLTAEWRKLAMFNYEISPSLLQKFVPYRTEIDIWNSRCYISLVGFMFLNTKLRGLSIPFHINFEEVNLRFYVKHTQNRESKRGVVFIKEIVPRPALTFVANTLYKENYETMAMNHRWNTDNNKMEVEYRWKKRTWHSISVSAENTLINIDEGSAEEFITEHFWGYTFIGNQESAEYQVEHPRWKIYPVTDFSVDVNFGLVYGDHFKFLGTEKPISVFLAEGSPVVVKQGSRL